MRPKAASAIRIDKNRPGVLVLTIEGPLTEPLFRAHTAEILRALTEHKPSLWLVDLTKGAGFDSGSVTVGREWLRAFKGTGGHAVHLVTSNSALRMAATAAGFAVGVAIKSFATRGEAELG
jgi:hypothetical protein